MDRDAFFNLFKGGTAKQRQEFVHHFKKVLKEDQEEEQLGKENQLIPLKRLSLSEFQKLIRDNLPYTKIKQYLRVTNSRKLYRL